MLPGVLVIKMLLVKNGSSGRKGGTQVKGPWNVALSINILLKNFNTKTLKPCPRNNLQEFQPARENCLKCQHHNLWT